MGDTQELQLLRKYTGALETALKANLSWVADEMNIIGWLNDEKHEDIKDPDSRLTKTQKASVMVTCLRNKVTLSSRNLGKFLIILKKKQLQFNEIITLFENELGMRVSNLPTAHISHQQQESGTSLQQAPGMRVVGTNTLPQQVPETQQLYQPISAQNLSSAKGLHGAQSPQIPSGPSPGLPQPSAGSQASVLAVDADEWKKSLETVDDAELTERDLKDLVDVVGDLAAEWELLAIRLGLRESTIKCTKADNPGNCRKCLYEILFEWLRWNYDYDKFGTPSWRILAKAVKPLNAAKFYDIVDAHQKVI